METRESSEVTSVKSKGRLFSLDCLRGLDMILLTVITPLVHAVNGSWPLSRSVMNQFEHNWGCFSLHDVIMPCFIFMCGAAIPFALKKRLDEHGRPTAAFWKHVLWRLVYLYVLGSLVQCNLLSFDPMQIHVFYNTLQVIGFAYVFTALMMLVPSRPIQVASGPLLLLAMGLIVHFGGHGDYSQTGNYAYVFDRQFWGIFLPAGQHTLKPNGYYCYLLPQLAAFFLTQLGYECALILTSKRGEWRKAALLGAIACAAIVAGFAVSVKVPVIKHIYSASFTLFAAGCSVGALAVLYVLTDIYRFRKGLGFVLVFGQNALAAYILAQIFRPGFRACGAHLTQGATHLFGPQSQRFFTGLGTVALFTIALYIWTVFKKRPHGKNQGVEK